MGGSARAAFRLHAGLLKEGIDSKMFVREKYLNDNNISLYKYPSGLKKIKYKILNDRIKSDFLKYKSSRPQGMETFSDDRNPLKTGFMEQLPEADIYHLHWISGFVDLPSFFSCIKKPVVWTLHDMFPFTGGCHYNAGCEKYKTHCQQCPQLGSETRKDLSYQIWERKHKTFSGFKNRIIIRADSHWLADEARKSSLFKDFDIDTIHYGIETDEFIPRDKSACRKALNIPDNKRIIVFGAPGINNPRKGFLQLEKALQILFKDHTDLFLLTFGAGTIPHLSIPYLHLGQVNNNNLLSVFYNCGDVFVIPSLQEAFGQTALEAMSCGIPVAGFDTGGIPDMIENSITGFLAETGNPQSLADAIHKILILNQKDYLLMSEKCRNKVINEYNLSLQAKDYIDIYNNLINH